MYGSRRVPLDNCMISARANSNHATHLRLRTDCREALLNERSGAAGVLRSDGAAHREHDRERKQDVGDDERDRREGARLERRRLALFAQACHRVLVVVVEAQRAE